MSKSAMSLRKKRPVSTFGRDWTLLVLRACEHVVGKLPDVSLVHELEIQDCLQDRAEDAGSAV